MHLLPGTAIVVRGLVGAAQHNGERRPSRTRAVFFSVLPLSFSPRARRLHMLRASAPPLIRASAPPRLRLCLRSRVLALFLLCVAPPPV